MMADSNPYQPATSTSELNSSVNESLGKPLATLVGVFACGAASIVIGETLSLIGLFPPLSHWLGFDNEFAGLILVGMPMLAGGTGALAGLFLGLFYPHGGCRLVSLVVGTIPALLFCYGNYASDHSPPSVFAISGIMIVATLIGVLFTHRLLGSIERRRAKQLMTTATSTSVGAGRVATVTATVIGAFSVAYDLWLWRVIATDESSAHEFPLILAFGLGFLAVAGSVYVWAAYPQRKALVITSGLVALLAFLFVISMWYLQLIS